MLENRGRQRTVALIASGAVAMVLLAGCGKGPPRVPASGSIEVDGMPLDGGILYFNPDVEKGNTARVNCSSPIRNGRFELQTAGVERSESGSGVPLGWYKVSVRVNIPGQPPLFPGQPAVSIDPRYLDRERTPLVLEVVENPAAGKYDLKLTSKK
jgi:hypothetical protein